MDNFENRPEMENPGAEIDEKPELDAGKTNQALLPEPNPEKEEQQVARMDAEPVVVVDSEENEELPTLYSEKVIYTFSVLFSVIAGGILLARNLKEVDRKDGIPHVIAFSLIYTLLSSYLLTVSKTGLVGTVVLAIIGSTVLNSYFWSVYIGKGISYYRKSYRKALIIALLILIPLFLIAVWGGMASVEQPIEGLRIN